MDKAFLKFIDLLAASVLEAKLQYVALGREFVSADPIVSNQIADGLTVIAYRRPPRNREGEMVMEG